MKTVKCASGLTGWQGKLQKVYDSFDEFRHYCDTYAIHLRLGYKSKLELWEHNPVIQGSISISDLRIVK